MKRELLTIDGIVNLALGVLLLWYPVSLAEALGLPAVDKPFFAAILGGVLFGIGLALLIERYRPPLRTVGLGLGGAIAINLCGAAVLALSLAAGRLSLTTFGYICLWALVLLLVAISSIELYSHFRQTSR